MVERKERITAEIDARIGKFKRKMGEVTNELSQVGAVMQGVGVAGGQLEDEFGDVAESSALASRGLSAAGAAVADVRREASAAILPIDTLAVSLRALPGGRVIDLDVESSEAQAELRAFRSTLQSIDREVDVSVDQQVGRAQSLGDLPDSVQRQIDVTPSMDRSALDSVISESSNIEGIEVPATVDLDETGEGRFSALRTRLATLDETVARPSVGVDIDRGRLADVRDRIDSALSGVRDMTATASITADTSEATQGLISLRERLESIDDESVIADIEAAVSDADSLSELRDSLDETGDQALGSSAELNTLEESVDALDDAVSEAGSMAMLTSRIDELGDEASESGREMMGLSAGLAAVTASAGPASAAMAWFPDGSFLGGLKASVGGLSGSLSTLMPLLAVLATVVPGALSALGGFGAALGAVGAGIGSIALGGLLSAGEQLAAQSEDIETAWQGVTHIIGNLRDELMAALAPLKDAGFSSLVFAAFDGLVGAVRLFSETVKANAPTLIGFAQQIGAAFGSIGGGLMSEFTALIEELGPVVTDALASGIRMLPGILRSIRANAKALAPALAAFLPALVAALPELADMGVAFLKLVLPVLSGAIDVFSALSPVISAFAGIVDMIPIGVLEALGSVLAGIAGAAIISSIVGMVSAIGGVVASLGGLLSAAGTVVAILGGPVTVAVGALVGALLYLSQNLDAVKAAWQGFVDFAAKGAQLIVDSIFGMVNSVLKRLEGLRQSLNAFLPESMKIDTRIEPLDAPDAGESVRDIGGAVDDMFPDSGPGGGSDESEGQGQGQGQGQGPTVMGDYYAGNVDNSKYMDVDTSEERRISRLVEDALDRSERHSNRRGSASQ